MQTETATLMQARSHNYDLYPLTLSGPNLGNGQPVTATITLTLIDAYKVKQLLSKLTGLPPALIPDDHKDVLRLENKPRLELVRELDLMCDHERIDALYSEIERFK